MDPKIREKTNAALKALEFVRDGMHVGLGSGSTSSIFIRELGQLVRDGKIAVTSVCTSRESENIAHEFQIPIENPSPNHRIDIYIDGADQIDGKGRMIKGGGGALLREKIIASQAAQRIIMVDETKPVSLLGAGFPLPVAVAPFADEMTLASIQKKFSPGASIRQTKAGAPYRTSDQLGVIDCPFEDGIADPEALTAELKNIPGVLEVGLFFNCCDLLLIGHEDRVESREFTPIAKASS